MAQAGEVPGLSNVCVESEYLSEDHDLVLMETRVLEQAESSSQIEDGQGLLALIALRREHLQKKAITLGVRLYAEEPESFIARIQTYWEEWRPAEVTSEPVESETVASPPLAQEEQLSIEAGDPDSSQGRSAGVPYAILSQIRHSLHSCAYPGLRCYDTEAGVEFSFGLSCSKIRIRLTTVEEAAHNGS
jgi:hypothetical protein